MTRVILGIALALVTLLTVEFSWLGINESRLEEVVRDSSRIAAQMPPGSDPEAMFRELVATQLDADGMERSSYVVIASVSGPPERRRLEGRVDVFWSGLTGLVPMQESFSYGLSVGLADASGVDDTVL